MKRKNYREIQIRKSDAILAYTLLRLALGINIFTHGLVRIGNIPGFAQSIVNLYEDIPIPDWIILLPAYPIPIIELVVGLLLMLGLQTRKALIAGFLLMLVLIFGICLLQDWTTAGLQLIYCLIYFTLLAGCSLNYISLDRVMRNRKS